MKKILLFAAAVATAAGMNAASYQIFDISNPGPWAVNEATKGFTQTLTFGDKTFTITSDQAKGTTALIAPDNNTYAWRIYKSSAVDFDFGTTKITKVVFSYDDMNSNQYCLALDLNEGWSGVLDGADFTASSDGATALRIAAMSGQVRVKSIVATDEAGESAPLTPTFSDNPGTDPGTTPGEDNGVIYQTAFDSNLDGWTKLNDTAHSDFNGWKINSNPVCAICNSYYKGEGEEASSNHAADSWIYREFDCTEYKNVAMTFEQAFGFDFPQAQVDNYTVNVREAGTTEWYVLDMSNFPAVPTKNWSDWVSNEFDLSEYDGQKIELGFRYRNDGSQSRAWELKNFVLKGDKTGAVNGIEIDAENAVYYNLQGVRVAQPENGIYIVVKGGKAVKVAL